MLEVLKNIRIYDNFDYSYRIIWGDCKWGIRLGVIKNSLVLLSMYLLVCRVSYLNIEVVIIDSKYLKIFCIVYVYVILLLIFFK